MRISVEELRNVKGIGDKTIERVYEYLEEQGELKRFKSVYRPEMHIDKGLYQGDCLELMYGIPDGSVDMILADLPYGTTACSWDEVIPFEPLWSHYKRIIKDNGVIVLFGNEPFSSKLRMSNLEWYRYDWVWDKKKPGAIGVAKYQPLRYTENVLVFYNNFGTYNPQMVKMDKPRYSKNYSHSEINTKSLGKMDSLKYYDKKFPSNILEYSNADNRNKLHPTQKPVELCEYLIKTYTNEGDVVLDNCMGSGTTGVACKNTGRRFIGMELDEKYFKMAKERIEKA